MYTMSRYRLGVRFLCKLHRLLLPGSSKVIVSKRAVQSGGAAAKPSSNQEEVDLTIHYIDCPNEKSGRGRPISKLRCAIYFEFLLILSVYIDIICFYGNEKYYIL